MHATRFCILIAAIVMLAGPGGGSAAPRPPADPHASIEQWREYVVDASDADAGAAYAVFEDLLRAWDGARVAPSLYVVESSAGPWAASLADGNVLLSRAAIEACRGFGAQRFHHLLAFVLAHEMAHQRANDLWHQRFFRRADQESDTRRNQLVNGMGSALESIDKLQTLEARADHDGLLIMASVGYDPFKVLDPQDFFTAWVENLWRMPCSEADPSVRAACNAAAGRALRARAQLETVASQASLYDLGVQAFVAGRFDRARRLFRAYGREHPGRLAYTALGLTDFSQALQVDRGLARTTNPRPDFEFPLLLDAREAAAERRDARIAGRGLRLQPTPVARDRLIRSAIEHFEKAVRLAPEHPDAYLLWSSAYLLAGNQPMLRGILQGQFEPRFQRQPVSDLLLAMALAGERRFDAAAAEFERLMDEVERADLRPQSPIAPELLIYTLYHNAAELARFRGREADAHGIWRRLAGQARRYRLGSLFRIAVARLRPDPTPGDTIDAFPDRRLARIGDTLTPTQVESAESMRLWLDGDALQLLRYADGRRLLVDPMLQVGHAWQVGGEASLVPGLRIGDDAERPFNLLGPPDRHLFLQSGEYLCYDRLGIALHVVRQQLAGWLFYEKL